MCKISKVRVKENSIISARADQALCNNKKHLQTPLQYHISISRYIIPNF